MNKRLFFFGCDDSAGHYLFPSLRDSDKAQMPGANFKIIKNIDGLFTPEDDKSQGAGQYFKIGPLSIIAWHDYTIDKRPGSNSNLIGYGYEGEPDQIIDSMFKDFKTAFPSKYKRQVVPIVIVNKSK